VRLGQCGSRSRGYVVFVVSRSVGSVVFWGASGCQGLVVLSRVSVVFGVSMSVGFLAVLLLRGHPSCRGLVGMDGVPAAAADFGLVAAVVGAVAAADGGQAPAGRCRHHAVSYQRHCRLYLSATLSLHGLLYQRHCRLYFEFCTIVAS
jgi:hypothetical protein